VIRIVALYMPCHDHVQSGTGRVHDWFYPLAAPPADRDDAWIFYVYDWLFPMEEKP
jgi:hypothetical protein